MSVFFQSVINTGKLYSYRKTLSASCKCLCLRKYSDLPRKFLTFDEVVAQRREEARRSLVVQVNSESSFRELHGYCSKYASINGIHHYKNSGGEHFMLIEFSTDDNLKDVLRSCSAYQKDSNIMALQSPFVWFRAVPGKKETLSVPEISLVAKDGTQLVDEDVLFAELLSCETVSDQMQLLYDRTMLNDLGVRLRYMVARQLEVIFDSLYANIAVMPFGSSVNGFGRMGCDLDLVLTNTLTDQMSDPNKRLVYHEKKVDSSWHARPCARHVQLVGEAVEARCAGAARVARIVHARVPILKYAHELAGLDCDLCIANMSGVYMSELLWLFGSLDARVRPLVFAVRRWAQASALTSPHPGRWITNFPLTLMVLFFLQQKTNNGFVLPSVKCLVKKAGKDDIRLAEENLNCTFLRDLNKLPSEGYSQNQSGLAALLMEFFEFYSQFDFQEKAISLSEGVPVKKPNNQPLYIVNPLDQTLNVSKNVSYEECDRLKMEVRNAAWQLESCLEGVRGDDWGLLGLIEKKSSRGLKKLLRAGNSQRLVSVKDLFHEKEEANEESFRSKLKRLTQKGSHKSGGEVDASVKEMKDVLVKEVKKEQKMKFKNSLVASEVYRIRRNKMV